MDLVAIVIEEGQKKEIPVCCETFVKATRKRSGHNGSDMAIHNGKEGWHVGTSHLLEKISHCPWCGKKVKGKSI